MKDSGGGERTACDYCPYSGVCGFDTAISGYRYRGPDTDHPDTDRPDADHPDADHPDADRTDPGPSDTDGATADHKFI